MYSVKKAIEGIAAEVIVVDNNSPDESVAYLQQIFPWVDFILNTKNAGYASANNLGYKKAKGDYILFLNPDTLLSEDCLRASLELLKHDSKAGALGIHMIDGTGRFLPESKRGFPSVPASFFKLSGVTRLFPSSNAINRYYMGWLPEKQDSEVEVLSGAYMMIKREVLEKTGGFDEQFFMYGEDIDLSYRIKQSGYKNYYLGEQTILHFKGESTRRDIRYTRLFYKAMLLFVKKHYEKKPSAFNMILQMAIATRGAVSFARQLISFRQGSAKPGKIVNALLVGEPADTKFASALLISDPLLKRKIIGVANPQHISVQDDFDEIIFCPGELSYSDVFKCMQGMRDQECVFRFSAAGSRSIVSSMSKRNSGEILVKRETND